MGNNELKRSIEALIFVADSPVTPVLLSDVLGALDEQAIRDMVEELRSEYEEVGHAFTIEEIAGGFQFVTRPKYAPFLKRLYEQESLERLSRPGLETLAIIAYQQPLTRAEAERIRGVNCDGVVRTLLERNLIKIVGRRDAVGRPFTYGTTEEFLERFGLGSLTDLPRLRRWEAEVEALERTEQERAAVSHEPELDGTPELATEEVAEDG